MRTTLRRISAALALLTAVLFIGAWQTATLSVSYGSALPARCQPLSGRVLYFKTAAPVGLHQCKDVDTWSLISGAGGSGGTAGRVAKWSSATELADSLLLSETSTILTVSGFVSLRHLIAGGTAPTITAGAGAGTSPTVAVAGGDAGGDVTITTGTSPAASNAAVATVNFASAYASAPRVVLFPAGANSAALSGATHPYVTSTTTGFTIQAGGSALAASTQYKWNYVVIQ